MGAAAAMLAAALILASLLFVHVVCSIYVDRQSGGKL